MITWMTLKPVETKPVASKLYILLQNKKLFFDYSLLKGLIHPRVYLFSIQKEHILHIIIINT